MFAYKNKRNVIDTKQHWINYLKYLGEDTTFEREVSDGRLTPVFLEISPHRMGKPSDGMIEWAVCARGEDDVDYVILEYTPLNQCAKWTEESVDLIEEL